MLLSYFILRNPIQFTCFGNCYGLLVDRMTFDYGFKISFLSTVSGTSVGGIARRAPMKTGAGVCVCLAQHHAQTAGVTHAASPVRLVTFSMVLIANK